MWQIVAQGLAYRTAELVVTNGGIDAAPLAVDFWEALLPAVRQTRLDLESAPLEDADLSELAEYKAALDELSRTLSRVLPEGDGSRQDGEIMSRRLSDILRRHRLTGT